MGRTGWRRRKATLLIATAVVAAGVGIAAYATDLLRRTELQTIDARYSIRGPHKPPSSIVFVAIDPETFQELRMNFPFPRRYDATVIDNLRRAGARTIAVDIDFSHATDERDDLALFEAVKRAYGKVVLAATEVGAHGYTEVLGGPQNLAEAGVRAAEDHFSLDPDGVVRRFAGSYETLGSFPVVAWEVFTHRRLSRSRFADGPLPINYAGPSESFPVVPYAKVLRDRFPPERLRASS